MLAPTESQFVSASSSQISSIHDAPPGIAGEITWRLINDADGSTAIAESSAGIVEIDDGHDAGLRRYDRAFTAPASAGRYLAVWRYFNQETAQTVVVAAAPASFAGADDVAARLLRPLTTEETASVPELLLTATSVIADAAGYDDGWAAQLSPVPRLIKGMTVELVCRALPNPGQYSQIRQQVGSYSMQVTQTTTGMVLTDAETLMVRRAVHGRTTDSAAVDSGFILAQDEYWLRKQAIRVGAPSSGDTIR